MVSEIATHQSLLCTKLAFPEMDSIGNPFKQTKLWEESMNFLISKFQLSDKWDLENSLFSFGLFQRAENCIFGHKTQVPRFFYQASGRSPLARFLMVLGRLFSAKLKQKHVAAYCSIIIP